MTRALFLAGAVLWAAGGVGAEGRAGRVPVLLELFTSEGCSSCPAADKLLEKFDREQPVAGADLIVLSEHVDYWNQLGWKDPYSSAFYSQRQRDYAASFGGEVYTPELVVDGAKGLVGSDEREAVRAVETAIRTTKQPLRVSAVRAGNRARVTVHMQSPAGGVLYVAMAHEAMKSQVLRGENAGRGLSHVAVVYSIEKAPKGVEEIDVNLQPESDLRTRIVAFVVNRGGRIVALGQTRL